MSKELCVNPHTAFRPKVAFDISVVNIAYSSRDNLTRVELLIVVIARRTVLKKKIRSKSL